MISWCHHLIKLLLGNWTIKGGNCWMTFRLAELRMFEDCMFQSFHVKQFHTHAHTQKVAEARVFLGYSSRDFFLDMYLLSWLCFSNHPWHAYLENYTRMKDALLLQQPAEGQCLPSGNLINVVGFKALFWLGALCNFVLEWAVCSTFLYAYV